MRLSDASLLFLETKKQEGFSLYTLRSYGLQHSLLIRDIGDINIEEMSLQKARIHISHYPQQKPSSIGHKVRAIKSLFKWLVEEEYLEKHPLLKLKEPKLGQFVPKALTIDEVEMLRDSCKTLLEHALIEFFFATGCRVGEVYNLNRDLIDWQRGAVTVLGKGCKEREVYFGVKARIWLKRYLDSRKDSDLALFVTTNAPHRMPVHRIQDIFKIVAKRCGLENKVHPHVLRHTFCTLLLNQGAPLATIQSLAGHSKPETTQRYAVLSGNARQQAYKKYFV